MANGLRHSSGPVFTNKTVHRWWLKSYLLIRGDNIKNTTKTFFCACYLFSPSLLMHGCLGNILMEWGRLQPGLFRASHSVLRELYASCLLTLLFPYLGSLSFFNSQFTSFKSSLFFVFPLRASDRVLSERRPARLCGRSWAGVCIASNSFSFAFRS